MKDGLGKISEPQNVSFECRSRPHKQQYDLLVHLTGFSSLEFAWHDESKTMANEFPLLNFVVDLRTRLKRRQAPSKKFSLVDEYVF